MNEVVVSVCMISYNHAPFIRQAIEGVLMQKTNFRIELVISDDCSTDHTRQICEEYAKEHPDIIRMIPSQGNLGMAKNFYETLTQCSGKYIAVCEGDDYWTHPLKLQKQVDFLEANEDFVIAFHPVELKYADDSFGSDPLSEKTPKSETTIYDLAAVGKYMQTCSVMFRNHVEVFPPMSLIPFLNDYFLWVWIAQFGKLKRLEGVMGVYRYGFGVYSSLDKERQKKTSVSTLENLAATLPDPTLKLIIQQRIASARFDSLPSNLKRIPDLSTVLTADVLSTTAHYNVLLRSLIKKLRP